MEFGCEHCWPCESDAAWEARSGHVHEADLIDESHFHVMIMACMKCTQRFLSVFTEVIDWADGEDPQYWTLLPLTSRESRDLIERQDSLTEAQLNSLGTGRRSLRRDHPKAAPSRAYWCTGIAVGPHD
jgi:hypothetical protein